ncbi:unnamed protein product [Paramecium sonneborni]|uniref:Uncharacterized protein n=1 Tax=Paramecium sonneborni TaxID=65129 RepID=A0A8S1K2G3_9CILI|nr:unnamed protein product [Paramecium sonneborni]
MNQQHKCQLKTLGYVRNYQSEFASSNIINHTLYHKYSASQNYYFTKEINDILGKNRTPATIQFYDDTQFNELGERMKRFYYINEQFAKIKLLTEFYKFHNDLPRFTVHKNLIQILNLYYDKKRKLEYYKIQRQIEYENRNNPNQPQKGIVGDKPIESQTTPESESSNDSSINNNVDNILQDIKGDQNQMSQEEISKISKIQDDQQSEIMLMLKAFNPDQANNHKNIQKYQVFKKSKPTFKKSLKLDEFALSQTSRTQSKCCNDIKVPLSTRFTTDSVSKVLKTSQERTKEINVQKESLIQLFNKYSKLSKLRIENKIDQNKESKNSIPEMKQLELKIMKSIKDMEKNTPKANKNKLIQNNKGLHQILSKVSKLDYQKDVNRNSQLKSSSSRSIKITHQLDCYKISKNFNSVLNPISYQNNPYNQKRFNDKHPSKLKANDLKKLMIYKSEKHIKDKDEKTQKSIPKLNLQTINTFNNLQTSLTFRNQTSPTQLLTPKPLTVRCRINNLINWQVKALQHNFNNNSQQK